MVTIVPNACKLTNVHRTNVTLTHTRKQISARTKRLMDSSEDEIRITTRGRVPTMCIQLWTTRGPFRRRPSAFVVLFVISPSRKPLRGIQKTFSVLMMLLLVLSRRQSASVALVQLDWRYVTDRALGVGLVSSQINFPRWVISRFAVPPNIVVLGRPNLILCLVNSSKVVSGLTERIK